MDEIQDDGLVEQSRESVGHSQVCVVNDELASDEDQNISFILVPESMLQALKDSGYEIPNVVLQNGADLAFGKSNENEIVPNSYVEICKINGSNSEPNQGLELHSLTRSCDSTRNSNSIPTTLSPPSSSEFFNVPEGLKKVLPHSFDNTNVVYTLSVNPTCVANNLETDSNSVMVDCVSLNCDMAPISSRSQSIPSQKAKQRKSISDDKSIKEKIMPVTALPESTVLDTPSKEFLKHCNNRPLIFSKENKPTTSLQCVDMNFNQTFTSETSLGSPTADQTKPKIHTCPHFDCPLSFKTVLNLKRHLHSHGHKIQHRGVRTSECSSKVCDKNLSGTPEDHAIVRPYKCGYPDCKCAFTLESKLRSHQKSHSVSKRYPCPFANCASAFHKQEDLKYHLKVHSCKTQENKQEEFPGLPIESCEDNLIYYLCPYQDCGTLFTTLKDAKQHLLKLHSDVTDENNNSAPVEYDEGVFEGKTKQNISNHSPSSIENQSILRNRDITDIAANTLPTPSQYLFDGNGEGSLITQDYISKSGGAKSSAILPAQNVNVLSSPDFLLNNAATKSSLVSSIPVTSDPIPPSFRGQSSAFSSSTGLIFTSNVKTMRTAIRPSSISSNTAVLSSPTKELRKQIVDVPIVTSKEHKAKQLYKCRVMNCNKAFGSKRDLKSHAAYHTRPEIYKCTYPNCPWSFKTPYKLKRHLMSHEQKKQYKCEFPGCTKVCSTTYNLQAHYKRHFEDNHLTCSICDESFPNKHKLCKHVRDTHNPEPLFICEHKNCGRKFHSSAALTTHVNSHNAKKFPLVCTEPGCNNKIFKKNCVYQEHIMTHHTGVKPYKCDFPNCKWAFPNRSKLRRHKMTHNATKRYFCPIANCKSAFHRLEHLKYHLRVHTWNGKETKEVEETPVLPIESNEDDLVYYLCPYQECGSLFTTLIGAKQHIQKLHSGTGKPSGEEIGAGAVDVPVSITLETMTKTDTKAAVACDDGISVIVNSDEVQQNEVTIKADSPASSKPNIGSLLSTMLQTHSCERPSEDILMDTKTLDNVPHDLQFVGIQSPVPAYPSGPNLDLDNVTNFTLTVQDSMSMRIDPSQYLLGTSGDFVTSARPVTEAEPMDFITLQQQSVYTAPSPADQFLNFSECEPSVDPNIIMPVPISLNQPSTSKIVTSINFENTDEEDGSTSTEDCNNSAEIGGSARTDCDAYRRACLGKKIKSGVNTTLFMSPKQAFLDECQGDVLDEVSATVAERFTQKAATSSSHLESTFNSFMITDIHRKPGIPDLGDGIVQLTSSKDSFYEVGTLMDDAASHKEQYKSGELEGLRDCARNFTGSTINLNDLA